MVYIKLKTDNPDMLGKGEGSDIGIHGGVTNGFANVLWHKCFRRVKTKKGSKYCSSTPFNIKLCRANKHTDTVYILGIQKNNYQL